ncbi:NAD(P)H-dependent oxidoreductase [Leptolyngbya sp. FACHB-541]|nr:NAD(P)H-dependent oxidoreductase [Leptolyngbya sp. FACHB-541]MBD1999052.1 NAD(P)H-dependent oxidoreductase [Leptolyngbya sp. FACHB-541]
MANILHIDSSPRGDRSKSRKLAKEFIAAWQDQHPDDVIIYRDLRQTPVPHVTEDWIAAGFTPPEALTPEMAELLKFSDGDCKLKCVKGQKLRSNELLNQR